MVMKDLSRRNTLLLTFVGLMVFALAEACHKDCPAPTEGDLEGIAYNPQAYTIVKPSNFPEVPVPVDNPMTVEGVQLGRRLFYDPILSADSTMSCASCHLPQGSFTDNKAVSAGINGIAGRRSAMSLLNVAYVNTGLFWDGRAVTLEDQALRPVEDVIELHDTWPNVVGKFKNHRIFGHMFLERTERSELASIAAEIL